LHVLRGVGRTSRPFFAGNVPQAGTLRAKTRKGNGISMRNPGNQERTTPERVLPSWFPGFFICSSGFRAFARRVPACGTFSAKEGRGGAALIEERKMGLTTEQVAAFERDGFIAVPHLLAAAEVEALRRRTEQIILGEVTMPPQFDRYLQIEPA